jgi:ATP-dependent DNA ligase
LPFVPGGTSISRQSPANRWRAISLTAALAALPQGCFVLDGELAIVHGETFSFDALLQRLHPAETRIAKLSAETPGILILFDMLLDTRGNSLIEAPLTDRRAALEAFVAAAGDRPLLKLSPNTLKVKEARDWLHHGGAALDGVVAKRLDGPYLPGERAMLKVKQIRTADCVVGGFRFRAGSREVGSLLLGLYDDDGKLDHVGFTATITNEERPALTKRLEALKAPPGFTGRRRAAKADGAPSAPKAGSRSSRSSWWRSPLIRSRGTASVTAPGWSASAPTRRRASAPSSRSRKLGRR